MATKNATKKAAEKPAKKSAEQKPKAPKKTVQDIVNEMDTTNQSATGAQTQDADTGNNKPLAQEVAPSPRKTSTIATPNSTKKEAVNVRDKTSGFVHKDIPATTAEKWMRRDANKWELAD